MGKKNKRLQRSWSNGVMRKTMSIEWGCSRNCTAVFPACLPNKMCNNSEELTSRKDHCIRKTASSFYSAVCELEFVVHLFLLLLLLELCYTTFIPLLKQTEFLDRTFVLCMFVWCFIVQFLFLVGSAIFFVLFSGFFLHFFFCRCCSCCVLHMQRQCTIISLWHHHQPNSTTRIICSYFHCDKNAFWSPVYYTQCNNA